MECFGADVCPRKTQRLLGAWAAVGQQRHERGASGIQLASQPLYVERHEDRRHPSPLVPRFAHGSGSVEIKVLLDNGEGEDRLHQRQRLADGRCPHVRRLQVGAEACEDLRAQGSQSVVTEPRQDVTTPDVEVARARGSRNTTPTMPWQSFATESRPPESKRF